MATSNSGLNTHGMRRKNRNQYFIRIDEWLSQRDLYRKNIAYDETCLFRAVSENLILVQDYHPILRKELIEHVNKDLMRFDYIYEQMKVSDDSLEEHLDKLQKHMVFCSEFEVKVLEDLYHLEIHVYNAKNLMDPVFYETSTRKRIFLLKFEDHYDAVYPTVHVDNLGFSQSLIYDIVYSKVFKIDNVSEIVQLMLHEKNPTLKVKELSDKAEKDSSSNVNKVNNSNLAPFPYKVAKALDPDIYRNTEYDTWLEIRKGVRCLYSEGGEEQSCYIQSISDDLYEIYLEQLVERKVVTRSSLSRLPDARPWELPYRYNQQYRLAIPDSQESSNKPKSKNRRRNRGDSRRRSVNIEINSTDQIQQDCVELKEEEQQLSEDQQQFENNNDLKEPVVATDINESHEEPAPDENYNFTYCQPINEHRPIINPFVFNGNGYHSPEIQNVPYVYNAAPRFYNPSSFYGGQTQWWNCSSNEEYNASSFENNNGQTGLPAAVVPPPKIEESNIIDLTYSSDEGTPVHSSLSSPQFYSPPVYYGHVSPAIPTNNSVPTTPEYRPPMSYSPVMITNAYISPNGFVYPTPVSAPTYAPTSPTSPLPYSVNGSRYYPVPVAPPPIIPHTFVPVSQHQSPAHSH